MKGTLKFIGITILSGAAVAAGHSLWENVLEWRTYNLVNKLKRKYKEKKKIVKFKKTK